MSTFFKRRAPAPEIEPPVGTVWTFTANGSFTVPATGKYQIELHGGGGGGAGATNTYANDTIYSQGGGGGGSGEIQAVKLLRGDTHAITIGAGGKGGVKSANANYSYGNDGADGGTTSFGSILSLPGGKGGGAKKALWGSDAFGGAASGSLGTPGEAREDKGDVNYWGGKGGEGNQNLTSQTYGDGGKGGSCYYNGTPYYDGSSGQPGAVILTYLGKE